MIGTVVRTTLKVFFPLLEIDFVFHSLKTSNEIQYGEYTFIKTHSYYFIR